MKVYDLIKFLETYNGNSEVMVRLENGEILPTGYSLYCTKPIGTPVINAGVTKPTDRYVELYEAAQRQALKLLCPDCNPHQNIAPLIDIIMRVRLMGFDVCKLEKD